MSLNARSATRVACAIGAGALAVVMHGSWGSRPALVEPSAAPEAVPEVLAFAEPAEADQIPGVQIPQLLGLEDAQARVAQGDAKGLAPDQLGPTAANAAIAAELDAEALESSTEAATTEAPSSAAVGAGGVADSDDPPLSADFQVIPPTEPTTLADPDSSTSADVDASPPDGDASGVGQAGDGPGDGFPAPPPAAPPTAPRYEDPSSALISASGRPFANAPRSSDGQVRIAVGEIRVAGLNSQTLAGFEFRPDVCLGARARLEQANVHDEVTRTIVFDGCRDDAGEAATAATLAAGLVDDGIFAVVPLSTSAFISPDTFTDAGIPYFGGADLPAFCGRGNPLGFGVRGATGCPVLDARGYALLAEPVLTALATTWDDEPAQTIAYAVEAGPRGDAIVRSRSFEADLLGWQPLTFFASLPNPADGLARWSKRVDELLAAKPDVVIIEGRNTEGLPAALRDAGFSGEVVLVGQLDPLDVADSSARVELAPLTVVSPGLDAAERVSDGWVALAGAAAAVGRSTDDIGLDFIEGYVAADMFVQALGATPEPVTKAALAETINDGWWYPGIDGVACGSWWPASHLAPTPCVSIARVEYFTPHLVPMLGLVETAPQLRFELG